MSEKSCPECDQPLAYMGERYLATTMRGLEPINHERLDYFYCPECGRVFPYLAQFTERKRMSEDIGLSFDPLDEHVDIKSHPRYREYVKEDPARKSFDPSSQLRSFHQWLVAQED